MTTTTTPTTCTVGPCAVTGARCGKPAVTTFLGRYGDVFAECAEHATFTETPAKHNAELIGARVHVYHSGVLKVGTVAKLGRKLAKVVVPVGTKGATKLITVRHEDMKVLA